MADTIHTTYRTDNAVNYDVPASVRVNPYLDDGERTVQTTAAVLVTGTTVFRVLNGPIIAQELIALCVTANGATASTLQYSADGTDGAATTFTGASGSLANLAAGNAVVALFTATTTTPGVYTNGVGISRAATTAAGMLIPAGIITMTIGTGSSTGTWRHYLRYRPMAPGVVVTAAF